MQVDWLVMAGLVGVALAISGSNVLVDFREWCKTFTNPWQPLRWVGVGLEFVGLVTDKAMATGFVLGMIWWSGSLPWSKALILSGLLTLSTAVGDLGLAMLHGLTRRLMGGSGGSPTGPIPIPRGGGRQGHQPSDPLMEEGRLPPRKGPMTEDEAFAALDGDDDDADVDRGALVRTPN